MNSPSLARRAIRSAALASTCASTFSISVSTSPSPRIRDDIRSGWNCSKSSSFSPTPTNLIGLPTVVTTESAAPPRASPSAFVKMMPVSGSAAANPAADRTASCPVMASATNRISPG